MGTEGAECNSDSGSGSGRLGAAVIVLAMLVSFGMASVLVLTNMAHAQRLDATRRSATVVPASGALRGINALDGSEWTPANSGRGVVVVFGVAGAGRPGDLAFWRDVASLSRAVAPDVTFVGFCVADDNCAPASEPEPVLILLTSMDPAQTHALAVAASQGQFFFYRGSQVQEMLPMEEDKHLLSEKIQRLKTRQPAVGRT